MTNTTKLISKILTMLFFAMLLGIALSQKADAVEFSGAKMEYMGAEKTGFYGFGLFTSDKRFDAELEFFMSTKGWQGNPDGEELHDNYKLFFFSFAAYFHFIRTDKISWYIGSGIMPWMPRSYAYHYTVGLDFFWDEDFRFFYNFRRLYNNAEAYHYPSGNSFSAGIKWTWSSSR